MANLKEIRKRIVSVKNTQKITKALKLVSAAKLRRAQQAMQQLRPYAGKYREVLESLAAKVSVDAAAHPLLERREQVQRVGVFAVSSDRGMCGGFNSSIQKKLAAFRRDRPDVEVVVFPVGRRMVSFAGKAGFTIGEAFGEVVPNSGLAETNRMTDRLVKAFVDAEVDEVVILSNRFMSAINQEPTAANLLPVVPEEADESGGASLEPFYEPGEEALLRFVVPRYVAVQVRQAVLESIAGEHAARMNAMNNATDNATEMISALTLLRNRARQAAITTELMEIIGGAEAIK
jgi:F-type H+-transporting ATPase subunit gamma